MLWLVALLHILKLAHCWREVRPLDLSRGVSCFPVFYDPSSSPASIKVYMGDDASEELKVRLLRINNDTALADVESVAFEHWYKGNDISESLDDDLRSGEVVFDEVLESKGSAISVDVTTTAVYCASAFEKSYPASLSPAPLIKVVNSSGLLPHSNAQANVADQWLLFIKILLTLWLCRRLKTSLHGKAVTRRFIKFVMLPQITLEMSMIVIFHLSNRYSPSDRPSAILHYLDYILSHPSELSYTILPYGVLLWSMGYGSVYGVSEDDQEILPSLPRRSQRLAWALLGTEVCLLLLEWTTFPSFPAYQYPDYAMVDLSLWEIFTPATRIALVMVGYLGSSITFFSYLYFSVTNYLKTRPLISKTATSTGKPAMSETCTFVLIASPLIIMAIKTIDEQAKLGWLSTAHGTTGPSSSLQHLVAASVENWPNYLAALWICLVGSRPNYAKKDV